MTDFKLTITLEIIKERSKFFILDLKNKKSIAIFSQDKDNNLIGYLFYLKRYSDNRYSWSIKDHFIPSEMMTKNLELAIFDLTKKFSNAKKFVETFS
jgi:hypothetical protein